jgi:beta-glucanase (GH16 family)
MHGVHCSSLLSQQRWLSRSHLYHQEPPFSARWIQLRGNEQFWTSEDVLLFLPNLTDLLTVVQVPKISGSSLIDIDTPQSAWTIPSFHDPSQQLQLVFSDEFEVPNRTFWPGDDAYFEAVDLHYWATNNLEWYDPKAIITNGGALEITMTKEKNHDLNYTSGMLTSWNKFCFTGGLIVANVSLPGASNVAGLWPAIWTLGNLGRAGYGASLEGLVRFYVN